LRVEDKLRALMRDIGFSEGQIKLFFKVCLPVRMEISGRSRAEDCRRFYLYLLNNRDRIARGLRLNRELRTRRLTTGEYRIRDIG
jgi:hypothetical protein